jgi:Asp-tRNA(Asn)/Glu-tRNA(Gln) amidotransferase C subunit
VDQARLVIRVQQDSQGGSPPPPGSLAQPRQLAEATRPPWVLPQIPAPQMLNPGQTARITDEAIAAARKLATTVGSVATLPSIPPLPVPPTAPKLPGLPSLPTPASTQPHATLPAMEAPTLRLPEAPALRLPEARTAKFEPGAPPPPVQLQPGAGPSPTGGGWLDSLNAKLGQWTGKVNALAPPTLPQLSSMGGAMGKLAGSAGAVSGAMSAASAAMARFSAITGPVGQALEVVRVALDGIAKGAQMVGQARAASATEKGAGWSRWFDDASETALTLSGGFLSPMAEGALRAGGRASDATINNSDALRMQQMSNMRFFGSSAQNAIAGDVVQSRLDQMKKQLSEMGDGFWARTTGGVMRMREAVTALETNQRLRPAILADASRLSPYSGQLSAAQAQAQMLRIRTDVQAADRHGGSLARYVQADVEYESALKNAMGPMKEAILKQSAALAEAQGDSGKLHEVLTQLKDDSAFLKMIREDAGKSAEFNKRMLEELKKIREDNQRSRMDGDDILRQLRDGVPLLDHLGVAEDPLAWNDVDAIKPLE